MVLCSERNVLEIINTDDIIKGSPKRKKYNITFLFFFVKKNKKYIYKLKYNFFLSLKYYYVCVINILIMVMGP
jgi:hypothetical protein